MVSKRQLKLGSLEIPFICYARHANETLDWIVFGLSLICFWSFRNIKDVLFDRDI